jgi:hypothetical protein
MASLFVRYRFVLTADLGGALVLRRCRSSRDGEHQLSAVPPRVDVGMLLDRAG